MPLMFDLSASQAELPEHTQHVTRYIQDNTTGFPVGLAVDNLYRDTDPQIITASEPITAGDLLNVYYTDTNELEVRKASAADPERYCNSLALSNVSTNSDVRCAVKVGSLPGYPLPTGVVYLSHVPGAGATNIPLSAAIHQIVGHVDPAGTFMFCFHSPFLVQGL